MYPMQLLDPQAEMSSFLLLGPCLLCRTELVPCSVPMQISTEAVLRAHSAPQHPQLQRKSHVHCRTAVVPCSVKVLCDGLAVLAAHSVPQHCPQLQRMFLVPCRTQLCPAFPGAVQWTGCAGISVRPIALTSRGCDTCALQD